MRLPRDVSGRQLAKGLGSLGYSITRQKGSHMRLTRTQNGEHHVTIPDHDPLRIGTLRSLVLNLKNASYCETVYGGTDFQRIAERFSAVDPSVPVQLLKHWRQDKLLVRLPHKFERLKTLPRQRARFIGVAFKILE